jgi:hypothetical protein
MSESLNQYRALLTQLLLDREAAGGELPDEEESMYVERLDRLWWQLSSAEQDVIDQELAEPPTASETPLNLVDCVVSEGSSDVPRKAA